MLPLLRLAQGRVDSPVSIREAVEKLADQFQLTPEDRAELLDSGKQRRFDNRINWAGSHLRKAGLLESAGRGLFRITERGLAVLARKPERVDLRLLNEFPEFQEFRQRKESTQDCIEKLTETATTTPEEALEAAYKELRAALASDILEKLKACSPGFFERTVVQLLVQMGYGGSFADAAKAVGGSGDGGIDGVIKQDRLGLDAVYLQAKRWGDNTVGRREIQQFAGALQGQKANKGVFITTSTFTREAVEFARHLSIKIVLIDGYQLSELMIDYGLGVSEAASYSVKRIDSDYFAEE
jgi:restriction system protein